MRPSPIRRISVLCSALAILAAVPASAEQLPPEERGEIRGVVLDGTSGSSAGTPVGGARVTLSELDRVVRSDRDGRIRITGVPPGRWTLRAEAPGLLPVTVPADLPDSGLVEVEVVFTDRLIDLDAVVATVSPLRNPVGYQPAQALDQDALLRRMGPSVGSMLDGEPGVAMRSLGPAPARPVVRGFDGDRVLVLENGERMGDLSETAADHALSLDPSAVNRIEIVRGPASLLYGASALGGVVNLMTRDLPESWSRGWSGTASTHGASVNRSGSAAASLIRGFDRWAATGRVSGREAGDLRTPEARLPGTGLSSRDGQFGVVRDVDGLRTGVSLSVVDRSYGIPEALDDADLEVLLAMERQSLQARMDWTPARPGTVEGVELRLNAARFFQQELERTFGPTELLSEDVELEFLQFDASATGTLRHGPLGPLDAGAVGLALRGRDYDVGGEEAFTPGIREGTAGVFTFQEVGLAPSVRLQFGTRVEGRRSRTLPNTDFPDSDERRSSAALSGSVGLNWQPASGWEVGTQVARAHRNPTVEERFADGPHLGAGAFEIGDPGLADEIGHGVDVFLRAEGGIVAFEVAGFLNRITNFVAFQPTGETDAFSGLPVFRYVATDARMLGGEVTLSAELVPGLRMAAGVDYVRGDQIASGETGPPLPAIPPPRGRMDLRYETPRGWIGSTTRAVSRQNRVAPGEDPTDGYVLMDADAGLRLGDAGAHTLVLKVENATNRLYRDHLSRVEERGFPMPARNLSLVYRVRF